MLNIDSIHTDCCGCGACAQVCPQKCFDMQANCEGFLRPNVNDNKCIECGLCEKVCPITKNFSFAKDKNFPEPKAYGGWNSDEEVRKNSSSGGAFSLFAHHIISLGGVVYACSLDGDLKASHTHAETLEELSAMRKSKYVQSEIGNVYNEVKTTLIKDRFVLFVGTPCQVAGLISFLGKLYEKLYTIDFICHGVPSPLFFQKYLNYISDKEGSNVVSFEFRVKDKGWNQSGLQLGTKIEYDNGTVKRNYPAFNDNYMNGFLDDVCLRPSCYNCKFKGINGSCSDYTIADFWGVDSVCQDLNDHKGTSLVLVRNEHAYELWDKVKDYFIGHEVDLLSSLKKNVTITKSANKCKGRNTFFKDLSEKTFNSVRLKYLTKTKWAAHKIIRILWNKYNKFIKFGLVGASNTLINLAVYYFLLHFGVNYLLAYTAGFLTSVCNAFFWNNKYVFKNKQETNSIFLFIKVLLSYGFSYLLSIVLLSVMVDRLHISDMIAPIIKLIITIPINFVLNKLWA
ncbi:MAG: Coenzyme F420 hydrogenase/dehydrogenase, beta subunit C-terminal domain, partial [Lachnospiraceae bacterium]|nr:Coenzyme F420 hydrogenase/dehydrogenase, beta subunit C-terminal domain [Lachnospiraceae bacterium]